MKHSQPLRVDFRPGEASFVTRRFRNSQLCYCNNKQLEERTLGSFGKYVEDLHPEVYGLVLFGSHDHSLLEFRPGTKSIFFQHWGARTAEAVKKSIPDFGRGSVFENRPAEQCVPAMDMLDRFFYLVLQPIAAGLCKNLSDYPGYNCFHDVLRGTPKRVEFFRGSDYRKAKAKNPDVDRSKFIDVHYITFKRLPGYEKLSQKEYRTMLQKEYEKRRLEIIEAFDKADHKWPSLNRIRTTRSTEEAKSPKKSERNSPRPLILTRCPVYREEFLEWYFQKKLGHWNASKEYRAGNPNAEFPPGTHKPPGPYIWGSI